MSRAIILSGRPHRIRLTLSITTNFDTITRASCLRVWVIVVHDYSLAIGTGHVDGCLGYDVDGATLHVVVGVDDTLGAVCGRAGNQG